jgi:hypothetical protein
METFCLIDIGKAMARWCILTTSQEGELVWIDQKARQIRFDHGTVVAHTSGAHFREAMDNRSEQARAIEEAYAWKYLLDPWSNQGWLAPEGKLWGCHFFQHDELAYSLMGKPPAVLESQGWIRVHDRSFAMGPEFRRPTTRQISTLEKLNFIDIEPPGWRDGKFDGFDRSLPPPRHAIRPPETIALPEKHFKPLSPLESLEAFVAKLRGLEVVGDLFSTAPTLVPVVGPGSWDWALSWPDFEIGGPESAETLLEADSLRIEMTSADTFQIETWYENAIEFGSRAREELVYFRDRMNPTQSKLKTLSL